MHKIKWLALLAVLMIPALGLVAQAPMTGDEPVQMADAMHANGKIYAVVAVVVLIVAGILFYLVRLDRKISRLEKEA